MTRMQSPKAYPGSAYPVRDESTPPADAPAPVPADDAAMQAAKQIEDYYFSETNADFTDERIDRVYAIIRAAYQAEAERAEALVLACEHARDWLNRYGENMPVHFGGEANLDEELRQAVYEYHAAHPAESETK